MTPTSFLSRAGAHLAVMGIIAVVFLTPMRATSANAPSPTPSTKSAATAGKRNPPFVGIVQKVDIQAGTLTLNGKDGGRVFHVNAETRITKKGQPATLKDARVGEEAAGTFKDVEGRRYAVSLRLGPKPETEPAPKK